MNQNDDHLLSLILPNFLRAFSRLNSVTITASMLAWNRLNPSITSALLHLMHLPTINHIDLSLINNFPLSSLTSSVNLHRLNIFDLSGCDPLEYGSGESIVQSEMIPEIHEFHTSHCSRMTMKLLHAKRQDGRPAFNFMDLRRLSMSFTSSMSRLEDEENIRYLLQNAKLLEKIRLSVGSGWGVFKLVGLHDMLSPSARTLKVLDLTVPLHEDIDDHPLGGVGEELEAMAGHNTLETLSIEVVIYRPETEGIIGSIIQKVAKVLVKPGWSALRQVSVKVSIASYMGSREDCTKMSEALQSLPNKYLSQLSKLDSVAFNYSVSVVE
jgi:hypothetical protein